MLKAVDHLGRGHAADGEDEDADKNFVGLERRARHGDHEADARCGGIEFADHNADERTAYREAMELMRHEMGEDAYLLACGAPVLSTIGIADGIRIGVKAQDLLRTLCRGLEPYPALILQKMVCTVRHEQAYAGCTYGVAEDAAGI